MGCVKYDTELIGLPVVDRSTGAVVGTMRGVVFRTDRKRIDGIVMEERGWMRRCRFVPWQSVTVLGDRSIIVDRVGGAAPARPVNCPGGQNKLYDAEGSYVGRISNYLIDEKNGAVLGMELSASVLEDLKFGRKIIENRGNIIKGEDFLMLANDAEAGATEQSERRSDDEGLY